MKLLILLIVTVVAMEILQHAVAISDEEKELELLEEQLLSSEITKDQATLQSNDESKRGLRAPCGFSFTCIRRRRSSRRRGFWGKRSEVEKMATRARYSDAGKEELVKVLEDIEKIAEKIEDEKEQSNTQP